MPVKMLNQDQKDAICTIYQSKTKTIKEMAQHLRVSPRTIGRVLAEAGLLSPVPRLKGEAHQVMELLKQYQQTPQSLERMLKRLHTAAQMSFGEITHNEIRHYMAEMDEAEYNKLLADIIHQREARKYNANVLTAMKKLQNQADAADRENKHE